MKKIVLIVLLITSILLTQCYTQKEYLTKDYEYNEGESIIKFILQDSTVVDISDRLYSHEIIRDTLIIHYRKISERKGDTNRYNTISDSIALQDIHSVVTSKYDTAKSFGTIVLIGAAVTIVIFAVLLFIYPGLDYGG